MSDSNNNTNMALVGTILDLSDSMRVNLEGEDGKYDSWLSSIFDAFKDLLQHHNLSEHNKVFAIGIGVNKQLKRDTVDLLGTLESNAITTDSIKNLSHTEVICKAMELLKNSGAPFVEQWAPVKKVQEVVSEEKAKIILNWLLTDQIFKEHVAKKILPRPCRHKTTKKFVSPFKNRATKEDIEKVVQEMIIQKIPDVTQSSVKDLREASNILIGSSETEPNQPLTKERIEEIKGIIKPLIYGETPLRKSLNKAANIFSARQYKQCHKFLFVLSDGNLTDGGQDVPIPSIPKLKQSGVQIISCYVTQNRIEQPKRLFSTECTDWDSATKFMFHLSSEKKTQEIPLTVFIKKGWKVDVANNTTKLFAQINHPDLLRDVSCLIRNLITFQDALGDILASISLDCYIEQKTKQLKPPQQVGGTCYANATAAVFHLAMHRIVGRDQGYPKFEDLKNDIIERYGNEGAETKKVLEEMCPLHGLHATEVNVREALLAVAAKRPVLATFYLTGEQWDAFGAFFYFHGKSVLSKNDLKLTFTPRQPSESGGHAVVLTSYSKDSLVFMNSWGRQWADNGFFSIANAEVLNCRFYDVYWTVNDLSKAEQEKFKEYGRNLTEKGITGRMVRFFESKLNFRKC